MTLAIGARQFVVQEALEMMWCLAGSYFSWFTPSTMVTSSFLAGAEMMTFFTGPRMCFLASFASVKRPVDSSTTCAPTDSHGSLAGSFSANTLIVLLSTVMQSLPEVILCGRFPRMESYLRRCASVLGSVRSLTATNSRLGSLSEARITLRPMRPNPLIPTLITILPPNWMRDSQKIPGPGSEQKMVTGGMRASKPRTPADGLRNPDGNAHSLREQPQSAGGTCPLMKPAARL